MQNDDLALKENGSKTTPPKLLTFVQHLITFLQSDWLRSQDAMLRNGIRVHCMCAIINTWLNCLPLRHLLSVLLKKSYVDLNNYSSQGLIEGYEE